MEEKKREKHMKRLKVRWLLVLYDALILGGVSLLLLVVSTGGERLATKESIIHIAAAFICVFGVRFGTNLYKQIWRYGGIQSYIRLLLSDAMACAFYLALDLLLLPKITTARVLAICSMNALGALAIRMVYRYIYKCGYENGAKGVFLRMVLRLFSGNTLEPVDTESRKVKIAIVGAGRVGVSLAEELLNNEASDYKPCCFIEVDHKKIDREIHGIPVLAEETISIEELSKYGVQEIVFATPKMNAENKKKLYERYKIFGCRIKTYDYPVMQPANGKRHMREFDIEDLLFRKPLVVADERADAYYRDKVIMITGGGGSIGSELCRQLAKKKPRQLVLVDVYENGAYDVQQELRMAYGGKLDIQLEILSVTNRAALERVFQKYRPQIVLHAAAHKHVPLMEKNCVEAIENNVFGTLNAVELSEKYGVQRFIMVSTDKAVNPTNVMGATKRVCEMIVQSHSLNGGTTTFSATRFGNVLGSAGSVIPLFKRQIANGGPVTVTDKRIIRYFMTIPEASQLVLQSGAMARNGELFVLDMGKPVKILDLAENMIKLAGFEPNKTIQIVETGLRPGEKLYEELLIKTEELDKTGHELIFIERDKALSRAEIDAKLAVLKEAVQSGSDDEARKALMKVVPTFHKPEVVNRKAAETSEEMRSAVG